MMIIEGADRFGLAQLHQLRGRVGRGEAQSFCVLVSRLDRRDGAGAARGGRRRSRDGFELAERDFELRREGDVLGLAQSGLPRLRVASLQRATTGARASAPAGTPRRCSTRPAAAAGPDAERTRDALARELRRSAGCVRRRGRGGRRLEPASAAHGAVADAGRVIAGTARGAGSSPRGRGRGRSPTGSSRRCSRSSSRTSAAPRSSTCSPAAARPVSRRCRGAPRARPSSSAIAGAVRTIAANLARPAWRAARPRSSRADALAWLATAAATTGRSTSSSSTRRTPTRRLLAESLRALGAADAGLLADGRPRRRQALLARRAAGRGSGC